jgi:type I restriction enzyme R subunit
VISPGYNDPPHLARYHLSEDEERAVRQAFRRPDELPKILIVTEKLLTGYDAPILYCMYLDKPMRDHVLLQAIARVNRPYEDEAGRRKTAGLIVDFVGIFGNLERALAFDSADVVGVVQELGVLRERFAALMATGREKYLPLVQGKTEDKALEAALERFRDSEEREAFYRLFRELEEIYEILSPDPFLRPFLEDYQQEQTRLETVREPGAVYLLGVEHLDALAAEERPDIIKVFNLLKEIQDIVERQGEQQPYLLSIGERAEEIARAFRERQSTTQQTLQMLLEGPVREIREAEAARRQSDLDPESFAVFWLLSREGVRDARQVAWQMADARSRYPHWATSEAQERELRRRMTGILLQSGLDPERAPGVVERLLRLLRRET